MIAIIDYGVGNLFSLTSSLHHIGVQGIVTADKNSISTADKIILPGVGAFADAIEKLRQSGLAEVITQYAKQGKPILGICLGMQLLFENSMEFGHHKGLGLIKGNIIPLEVQNKQLKTPHMGWNQLEFTQQDNPLLQYNKNGDWMYYVHSYYFPQTKGVTIAASDYGAMVSGVVQNKNVVGTQFHPEKSGDAGLAFLKAFAEVKGIC